MTRKIQINKGVKIQVFNMKTNCDGFLKMN